MSKLYPKGTRTLSRLADTGDFDLRHLNIISLIHIKTIIMEAATNANCIVSSHPLIVHKLSLLRDRPPSPKFRELISELGAVGL